MQPQEREKAELKVTPDVAECFVALPNHNNYTKELDTDSNHTVSAVKKIKIK